MQILPVLTRVQIQETVSYWRVRLTVGMRSQYQLFWYLGNYRSQVEHQVMWDSWAERRQEVLRKFRRKSATRALSALQSYADYPKRWNKLCMFRFTDFNTEGTTRSLTLASSRAICSAACDPLSVSCLLLTCNITQRLLCLGYQAKGSFGAGGKGILMLSSTKYKIITGNSVYWQTAVDQPSPGQIERE